MLIMGRSVVMISAGSGEEFIRNNQSLRDMLDNVTA